MPVICPKVWPNDGHAGASNKLRTKIPSRVRRIGISPFAVLAVGSKTPPLHREFLKMLGDGFQDHQPMELSGISDLTSKLGAMLHLYTAMIRKYSVRTGILLDFGRDRSHDKHFKARHVRHGAEVSLPYRRQSGGQLLWSDRRWR